MKSPILHISSFHVKSIFTVMLSILCLIEYNWAQRPDFFKPLDNPEEYHTDSAYIEMSFTADSSSLILYFINNTDKDIHIKDFNIYTLNCSHEVINPYKFKDVNRYCREKYQFNCGTGTYFDIIFPKHSYFYEERNYLKGYGDIHTQQYYVLDADEIQFHSDTIPYITSFERLYKNSYQCIKVMKQRLSEQYVFNYLKYLIALQLKTNQVKLAHASLDKFKPQIRNEKEYEYLKQFIQAYPKNELINPEEH